MAENEPGKEVSRRSILRSTTASTVGAIGSGVTLSSLFGTAKAEEATSSDLEWLNNRSDVQKLLSELGVSKVTTEDIVEKRKIEDNGELTEGELVTWRIEVRKYGILYVLRHSNETEVVFLFDEDIPETPTGYDAAKLTGGSMAVINSRVVFSRHATEKETRSILSNVPGGNEAEQVSVEAVSPINGFRVRVATSDSDGENTTIDQYVVQVNGDFDPRVQELSNSSSLNVVKQGTEKKDTTTTQTTSGPTTHALPSPTQVAKSVIQSWLVDNVIPVGLDAIGRECDDTCTDCANVILNIITGCSLCRPLMTTGSTGVGAILFVACYYAVCGPVSDKVDCAACFACLLTNDEPEVPDEADALDWVWDELPSPPSIPV